MKPNIPIFILISLLTFTLSSCEDGCKGIRIRSYHLIDCYEEWSSFELSYDGRFIIKFIPENRYYSYEVQDFFCPTQTIENLNRFNELAAKNKDVGYDWVKIYFRGDRTRSAAYPGIAGMQITSDRDYDESHPAGTPLNDIFIADYNSYTQFLGDTDHSDVYPANNILGHTEKPCNEIEKHELSVIYPYVALWAMHAPTAWTGKHMITVTLTDENGNTHSQTAETDLSDFKRIE